MSISNMGGPHHTSPSGEPIKNSNPFANGFPSTYVINCLKDTSSYKSDPTVLQAIINAYVAVLDEAINGDPEGQNGNISNINKINESYLNNPDPLSEAAKLLPFIEGISKEPIASNFVTYDMTTLFTKCLPEPSSMTSVSLDQAAIMLTFCGFAEPAQDKMAASLTSYMLAGCPSEQASSIISDWSSIVQANLWGAKHHHHR